MDQHSHDSDILLGQAAGALFGLGRLFSSMSRLNSTTDRSNRGVKLSRVLVVQAIEAAQVDTNEVTVGITAQQLGVEPSTASRLVADAIKDGYVVRTVSPSDHRCVQLALTDVGRTLAQDVQAYQVAVFRQITNDWEDGERTEFARLFVRFADSVAASVHAQAAETRDHEQSQ